jgi:putative tricarboxylic transport membrane protein
VETFTLYNFLLYFSSVFIGIFAGLIPGLGVLVCMLLVYPLLLTFDLFQCLLFYLSLYSASQFSGSIVATTMAIPGESSSLPAVKEGYALYRRGHGSLAISGAAIGSIFGAGVACLLTVILMPYALYLIKNFYNNTLQTIILLSVSVFIVCINKNLITNIFLFVFGLFLATIGFQSVPPNLNYKEWIPYDVFHNLVGGLPTFPVLVALFVVPILAKNWASNGSTHTDINKNLKVLPLTKHLKNYCQHFFSGVRGSVIGVISGLVPHLTTILAANLSYTIEKKIGIKRKTYNENGDMASLISSETANNGAAFTSLLPLVLLGIPITTSEAVLLSILERNNYFVNYQSVILTGLFNELMIWFIAINILAFTLAWPMVKYVNYLYKMPTGLTFTITFVILLVLIGYVGSESYQMEYYYAVFLLLAPIGYLLRNTDTIVIIVGFILQDKIFAAVHRAIIIWSS